MGNKSISAASKQTLMADHISLLSPSKTPKTLSSFLGSPFFTKPLSDVDATVMTPKSILDTKNLPSFGNDSNHLPKPQTHSPDINNSSFFKSEPEAIGLALVDSIHEEKKDGNFSKPIGRISMLRSNLKVQIPASDLVSSLSPPADFGIKTRSSQFLSPVCGTPEKNIVTRQLSWKEMELSEDYTCVIAHGPNPMTTHIFDDCCGDILWG